MKSWIKKHMIMLWIIASIIYAFVIHCFFSMSVGNAWLVAKWSAGEILTYASTVSLSLLAVWQNQKFQRENDSAQARLESINKHSNEIAIINKIIEYETENMRRLRKAFDEFSHACDPQTIGSHYIVSGTEVGKCVSTMANDEQTLDDCFFKLGRELRANVQLKKNDEEPLKKAFKDYYLAGKVYIVSLQQNEIAVLDERVKQLVAARAEFIKERERYLMEQESKLNKLLYENLNIDEIRLLYKKDM